MGTLTFSRSIRVAAPLALLAFAVSRAQVAPAGTMLRRQTSQEEGSVDAVGKFTPRGVTASTPSPLPRPAAEAAAELKKRADVRQTGPDTFQIGQVSFDAKARTVTIPALVNMRQGLIEYALVTEDGKRHESLFYTQARADQVHLACLLLGATSVPASRIEVDVTWKKHGPDARYPMASLVVLKDAPDGAGEALSDAEWECNGSCIRGDGFAAQMEGSVIALISDGAALVGNPRADCSNDDIHYPNSSLLPAEGVPVDLVLKFPHRPPGPS
jgi:hypothetical protein